MPASICLPAYNEVRTIEATLTELSRLGPDIDEILVCLNGCTDGTEAVVEAFRAREPRLTVIESELGKNNAWNALVTRARNGRLVFTDADVRPDAGSISALLRALERAPHAAVAAAFEQPRGAPPPPLGTVIRLLTTSLGQDYISGRLYAIDRDRLAAVMARRGLLPEGAPPRLPTDVVTEDSWLTALVAGDALVVVPEAPIQFEVDSMADVIRALARNAAAREQLRTSYPELYQRDDARLLSARTAPQILLKRLRSAPGPDAIARGLGGMALRAALHRVVGHQIRAQRDRILADVRAGRGGRVMATSGRLPSKGG
ncbi:glycosyltransferase family 2 protein [Sorangium sp. So ce1024]|uniref:glycosyltransferase family 2 protein n=1 Tax=Sorangium sp. So ce1024 TaxID=3133327 RepID=UPI003F059D70